MGAGGSLSFSIHSVERGVSGGSDLRGFTNRADKGRRINQRTKRRHNRKYKAVFWDTAKNACSTASLVEACSQESSKPTLRYEVEAPAEAAFEWQRWGAAEMSVSVVDCSLLYLCGRVLFAKCGHLQRSNEPADRSWTLKSEA